MKRSLPLFVAAVLAVGLTLAGTGPAGAAKFDNCDLLTKKQASKILGYKVVATKLTKDKSTGAEECEFRTKHYFGKNFVELGAPYKLQITTQPLTDEVETALATLQQDSDSEAVPELGDDVFFTPSNELVAVVPPLVIQFDVANYSTEGGSIDDIVHAPPIAAAKILLPTFRKVTDR